jgi:thiamine-monophosphate kinase
MATEFELIDRFLRPFAQGGAGLVLGPGDDCAVVRPSSKSDLCVTTDATVEDVHFTFERFSNADIGYKALAVNLSDLAAMGAAPRWFVCSLACRPRDVAHLPGIARGMSRLAAKAGIVLVGGNLSRAEQLSVHITAAGEVPAGKAMTRSGARAGDHLYVTGTLGDAALAIAMRQVHALPESAFARQARPTPRLEAGRVALPFATAAIDISDGLLQDVWQVARASGVGVSVDARLVPRSAVFVGLNANLDLALTGGEDYELALFVPARKAQDFERAMRDAGEKVTQIGEAHRGRRITVENAPHLKSWGHDHFGGRTASRSLGESGARHDRRPKTGKRARRR